MKIHSIGIIVTTLLLVCYSLNLVCAQHPSSSLDVIGTFNLTSLPGLSKAAQFEKGSALSPDGTILYTIAPYSAGYLTPPYPYPFYLLGLSTVAPIGKVLHNVSLYYNGEEWGEVAIKAPDALLVSASGQAAYAIVSGRTSYGPFFYYVFEVNLVQGVVAKKTAHAMTTSTYPDNLVPIEFFIHPSTNTILWINPNFTGFDMIDVDTWATSTTGDLGVGAVGVYEPDLKQPLVYFAAAQSAQNGSALAIYTLDLTTAKVLPKSIEIASCDEGSVRAIAYVPNAQGSGPALVAVLSCNVSSQSETRVSLISLSTQSVCGTFSLPVDGSEALGSVAPSRNHVWLATVGARASHLWQVPTDQFDLEDVAEISTNGSIVNILTTPNTDVASVYWSLSSTLQLAEIK